MEHAFGFFVCICILAKMHTYFGWDVHFGSDHILVEMCILVAMHTFWRRCAFWGTHLHLHFGCKAHILEDVHAFRGSYLHLHFGCNVHLFWRRCTLNYNCIHMFTEEMTLIQHYCNPYHISSSIEENKTNFVCWMHEPNSNLITSHFRWDAINQI